MLLKRLIICLGVVLLWTVFPATGGAYWVWTPETGKWVNPKYASRDTPEEQFEWAMNLYVSGDYQRAIKEFKKLIKHSPLCGSAPRAQYYIAQSLENLGKHYKAFLAYQKAIDDYPGTTEVKGIAERQYQIAELFFTERKKLRQAVEIFREVINNEPHGEYGDIAQYKIGLCYKKLKRYQEARSEFERLLSQYPHSQLVDETSYQKAFCSFKMTLMAPYDQELMDEAIEELEDFLWRYADSQKAEEVSDLIRQLKERKAENAYRIAEFYEKQRQSDSAAIYYEEIVDNYPDSPWAAKALERLEVIKKR